jgi:hypothetical protein
MSLQYRYVVVDDHDDDSYVHDASWRHEFAARYSNDGERTLHRARDR